MVTASIILWLVDQGIISLDDHPQAYLDFWPTTGNRAAIELRHLLNFTSGLNTEPGCLNFANANFASCVETILDRNANSVMPGDVFFYASTHLQVAGLMAIQVGGFSDWQQLFEYFTSETQLFTNAAYDLPSVMNPRLAGGMHWQADEFIAYIDAIVNHELLSPALRDDMTTDQISQARIVYSPVSGLGGDWHYGLGLWVECPFDPFSCTTTSRVSSIGTYGAYPFIDFEQQYFGIIAREGAIATGHEGY